VIENVFGAVTTNQSLALSGTKPVITKISFATARIGSSVTLTGKNFAKGVKVFIGKTAVSNPKLLSTTRLSLKIPSNAKSGFVSVNTFAGSARSKSILRITN
jgi:hypothetical protein